MSFPANALVKHVIAIACLAGAVQDDVYKYPLSAEPPYMKEIQQEVQGSEPPVFSEQGQATGKTRGRKPRAKATPKAKAKAKARAKATAKVKAKARVRASKAQSPKAKAAPKKKAAPMPKQKADRSAASAASRAAASAPSTDAAEEERIPKKKAAPKPKQKADRSAAPAASRAAASAPSTDAAEEERVPPSHVTHNHIYSSAYRKALAGNNKDDKEFARKQAAAAVEHFKLRGTVNELCGQFRPKPRARRVATHDGTD